MHRYLISGEASWKPCNNKNGLKILFEDSNLFAKKPTNFWKYDKLHIQFSGQIISWTILVCKSIFREHSGLMGTEVQ